MQSDEMGLVERLRNEALERELSTDARPLLSEAAAAIERLVAEPANLLRVIADIREASGLGAKPMLSELAGEIGKLKADRDRLECNRDMWKGQRERQAAELTCARQALGDT